LLSAKAEEVPAVQDATARGRGQQIRPMKIARLALLALLLAGGEACHGPALPLSAQQGSTVLVPIGGNWAGIDTVIGYGGAGWNGQTIVDHQRGEMLLRVDSATGTALVTRATTTLIGHPASRHARDGDTLSQTSGFQHAVIADIPLSVSVGTHDLYLSRQPPSGPEIPISKLNARLEVLPNSVATSQGTIVGAPTPFEGWPCYSCSNHASVVEDLRYLVPDPQLEIVLDTEVWAVELEILYPASVIDVVDVVQVPRHTPGNPQHTTQAAAVTWFEDDTVGRATASAASKYDATFKHLSVVFTLDDGPSQALSESAVTVNVLAAYDGQGAVIPGVGAAGVSIY
jgi:hypothetical protein